MIYGERVKDIGGGGICCKILRFLTLERDISVNRPNCSPLGNFWTKRRPCLHFPRVFTIKMSKRFLPSARKDRGT